MIADKCVRNFFMLSFGILIAFIGIKPILMPYNLKSVPNAGSITTNEDWEIKYWAQVLGCSVAEVIPAVKAMLKPVQCKQTGKGVSR